LSWLIYSKVGIEAHFKTEHPTESIPSSYPHSLDWLVVVPGLDHLRYNGAKAILSLFWDSHFKHIAVRLGYTSPKALQMAKDCSDLHQTDQILAAMMETGAEVLGKYYIQHSDNTQTSTNNFLNFLNSSSNNNVILLREIVFTYCLGYFILKGGIRKCDKDYVYCGKDLIGQLVFASNHPLYRKLYAYMDFDRACMPKELLELTDNMVGVKVKGKGVDSDEVEDICEHFDFCVGGLQN
jgi:hypothetical protein